MLELPSAQAEWEKSQREAKLAAVQAGVTTFGREFLDNILMPDGRTVYDSVVEPMHQALSSGAPR